MIQITSIRLTDFGRHKQINKSVDGHVVGLCGPNGRGKSTVLQAVQFALTGTIDHPDPLRAFIRRSSGSNPPKAMQVEVGFIANGKRGTIMRRVTPTTSSRKLEMEGLDKPLTAEKAVNDLFFELLGVDKKAINSTVFIRQGEMASMFGKDVERRDFYTRLLMLGHLEKVSGIIETFRASREASVQDLGPAKDAADATYKEAADYFEECQRALAETPSQEVGLGIARRVLQLFEKHAAAEDEAYSAKNRLAQHYTGDNSEEWLKSSRDKLAEIDGRLTDYAERESAHMRAKLRSAEADKALQHASDTVAKFLDAEEVRQQLNALGDIGENPAGEIASYEELIRKMDRMEQLNQSLPDSQKVVADLKEKVAQLTDSVVDQESLYTDARDQYSKLDADLKVRREIKAGIDKSHDAICDGCLVCGSTNPDSDFLTRTIAEKEAELDECRIKGSGLAERLRKLREDLTAAKRDYDRAEERLSADVEERRRCQMATALATKDNVLARLSAAESRRSAYAAKVYEHQRLSKLLADKESRVKHLRQPTDNELNALRAEVEASRAALALVSWQSQDEQDAAALKQEATSLRRILSDVASMVVALDSAVSRCKAAEHELNSALGAVPKGFYSDVIEPGTALTVREAMRKIEMLEELQRAHDEVRGRVTAANERLKDSSRRISELDLRIAEQKYQLKLVNDLKRLRDTFKPSGASLDYLNYKFGKIAQLASEYLAESGADFMVTASAEQAMAFDFIRTDRADEVWMPQNRMSGGQKVRLAVATLRAIHAMIMPDVGLLVLDEPTTHLDDEAKRSMADMLHKIGEEGTLQMIVCDHSPILIDAFSDVIDIPE